MSNLQMFTTVSRSEPDGRALRYDVTVDFQVYDYRLVEGEPFYEFRIDQIAMECPDFEPLTEVEIERVTAWFPKQYEAAAELADLTYAETV